MNENARKWVEALRSGEYKQGRGRLNRDGRFCCLGVACDLASRDGIVQEIDSEGPWVRYDGRDAWLPDHVMEWLGLRLNTGAYRARNHRDSSLAERNDQGASFKQIADIIESEPEGLFF